MDGLGRRQRKDKFLVLRSESVKLRNETGRLSISGIRRFLWLGLQEMRKEISIKDSIEMMY